MKQKATVVILGRGSFIGTIIRENTAGYYITWPAAKDQLASPESGEWFAKNSNSTRISLHEI